MSGTVPPPPLPIVEPFGMVQPNEAFVTDTDSRLRPIAYRFLFNMMNATQLLQHQSTGQLGTINSQGTLITQNTNDIIQNAQNQANTAADVTQLQHAVATLQQQMATVQNQIADIYRRLNGSPGIIP